MASLRCNPTDGSGRHRRELDFYIYIVSFRTIFRDKLEEIFLWSPVSQSCLALPS